MANTDQIFTITSTELVHNEVDDRATMSQKSSLPHVTRFVSGVLPSDTPNGTARINFSSAPLSNG